MLLAIAALVVLVCVCPLLLPILLLGVDAAIVAGEREIEANGRLPGLLPISVAALLLPRFADTPKFRTFVCAADITLDRSPTEWSFYTLGIFEIAPGADHAGMPVVATDIHIPTEQAVMTSAALPIAFQPLRIRSSLFLDGGLEANLPAGHLHSNWTGECAILIIPRPLRFMDPHDHVDYRAVRFLRGMLVGQAQHRPRAAQRLRTGASSHPTHTFRPVLLVAPDEELESGLITGFFKPKLLEREYRAGEAVGRSLVAALKAFEGGDDRALNSFLLEEAPLPELPDQPPLPKAWAYWANTKWLTRGSDIPDGKGPTS